MFYDDFGRLLDEAGRVLTGTVREHVEDERVRAQLDGVASLLADLAAMWEGMFQALEQENRVLEAALRGDAPATTPAPDPLARQRAALAELNERLVALGESGRPHESVHELRTALLAAADAQAELVARAARRPQPTGMRRI
jgi:hypothetical protein